MCRNVFCGFQVQKATCPPLCSSTVGKADCFYSGTEAAEAESFSPVLGESQTQGDPACR